MLNLLPSPGGPTLCLITKGIGYYTMGEDYRGNAASLLIDVIGILRTRMDSYSIQLLLLNRARIASLLMSRRQCI